jgi:hypothetical protein
MREENKRNMSRQRQPKTKLKERRRKEAEANRRRRTRWIGALAIVAIVVLGLIIFRFTGTSVAGIVDFGLQQRGHDEGVEIEASVLPPVGGVHSPRWQNCGIYDRPVETKNAVHSMEHGAVWITYQPELPEEDVAVLSDLVRGQTYLLLTPYPGLKSPVVLSAWGIQLEVDSVDDARVEEFIGAYRLGPQTPEFGAACSGGVGLPSG